MAWGAKVNATQLTGVAGTETAFDVTPQSNPGEAFHVEVQVNSSGTTDNVIVRFYGTLDDASENWDDVPFLEKTIDATSGNDEKELFIIYGVYKWEARVIRDGSTDTFTCDLSYRRDNISV